MPILAPDWKAYIGADEFRFNSDSDDNELDDICDIDLDQIFTGQRPVL